MIITVEEQARLKRAREDAPLPRRLAWIPRPIPDESLMSWVDQVAAEFGMTRRETAESICLGVNFTEEPSVGPIGNLIQNGCATILHRIAARTGLDSGAIRAMTFARYEGKVMLGPAGNVLSWGTWTPKPWALGSTSHACPACLAENGGRWLVKWLLPWYFLCPRHRCYLIDRCECGVSLHWSASSWSGARRDRRKGEPPCSAPPEALVALPVADEPLIALQRRLVSMLDEPANAGVTEVFVELHQMTRFVLYFAEAEALVRARADHAVIERFAQVCERRTVEIEGPNKGSRAFWGLRDQVPGPLLAAAAVRMAAEVVLADDVEYALRSLLSSARQKDRRDPYVRARWERFTVAWPGSPRLRDALLAAGLPVSPSMPRFSAAVAQRWRKGPGYGWPERRT